jgi:Family of unknown function (DUF6326)
MDMKVKLQTLWIFVILNFIYADVIALMAGINAVSLHFTPVFLLLIVIYLEIPIAMVLLSRVLPFRANRWANIIAGIITTVVNFSAYIFGSTVVLFYIFFGILEIAATLLIVWFAWKWHEEPVTNAN